MEEKNIEWYLSDIIIPKFETDPLQTVSYLISFGTEIIGILAALCFAGYYFTFGKQRDVFNAYYPNKSYTDGIFYIILGVLFLVSFILLCITYLKTNTGLKKIIMIISMAVLVLGTLFLIGLEILWAISIRISGMPYIYKNLFWIMDAYVLVPVIAMLTDNNLKIYMQKCLFSCIRTLLIIPTLLSFLNEGSIGIILVLLPIIAYIYYGEKFMCPCCKKGYSLKKTDTFVIDERDISVIRQEKTIQYNNQNEEIAHSVTNRYVPGTETTYEVNYVCKYCGYTCRKTNIKKTANV